MSEMKNTNHSDSSNKEPGFDSIPDVSSGHPAPLDPLNQVIGGIMDEIQEDATGTKPSTNHSNENNSKH